MYLTARVTTPPPPLILNFSLHKVFPRKAKEATGLTLLSRKRPEQLAEEHVFPIASRHKSPEIWELTKGRHKRVTLKEKYYESESLERPFVCPLANFDLS